MDTKKVEEKLRECLNNLSNDVVIQEYIGQFVMLLDEKKITMETACLAIDGIDLDHGVNFLDVFESLDKKQVQEAWKKIRLLHISVFAIFVNTLTLLLCLLQLLFKQAMMIFTPC